MFLPAMGDVLQLSILVNMRFAAGQSPDTDPPLPGAEAGQGGMTTSNGKRKRYAGRFGYVTDSQVVRFLCVSVCGCFLLLDTVHIWLGKWARFPSYCSAQRDVTWKRRVKVLGNRAVDMEDEGPSEGMTMPASPLCLRFISYVCKFLLP